MSYRPEPGYISGLLVNITSSTEALVSSGACRDGNNEADIAVPGGVSISIDISVNGANGLDAGAVGANNWYAVHVIDGPAVSVAGLFSLSATNPTLPAGYTHFRRVGWGRTNPGGNLLTSQMFGNGRTRTVLYNNPFANRALVFNAAATVWTDVDCSTLVPATSRRIQVEAFQDAAADSDLQVRGKGFGNTTTGHVQVSGNTGGAIPRPSFRIPTDAAQTIQYQNTAPGGTSDIYLVSYLDDV